MLTWCCGSKSCVLSRTLFRMSLAMDVRRAPYSVRLFYSVIPGNLTERASYLQQQRFRFVCWRCHVQTSTKTSTILIAFSCFSSVLSVKCPDITLKQATIALFPQFFLSSAQILPLNKLQPHSFQYMHHCHTVIRRLHYRPSR